MRSIIFAAGMSIMISGGMGPASAGNAGDGHTTVVEDENGKTVITQSGDPAQAEVRIDKEPGRTTVYRRSGGNTTVVTQSSGASGIPADLLDRLFRAPNR